MSDKVREVFEKHVHGLDRAGMSGNVLCYCPIHGEKPGVSKSRSLSLNLDTGQWHCFAGCGGGSIRSFLTAVTSKAHANKVWDRLQPYLKKARKRSVTSSTTTEQIFRAPNPIPERVLGLFENCPEALLDAGFDPDVLWDHDIGYDLERNRITFPIRDVDGFLAAISGRNPDGYRGPKYKVYDDSKPDKDKNPKGGELYQLGYRGHGYNNRKLVWRCDQIYPAAFVGGVRPTIYMCEGYKAALWLVQHGYQMTGAFMGSDMTPEQKLFLERMGGTVVLCLDSGRAGVRGTYKIGYKLRGLDVRVLPYPESNEEDLQPDDLREESLHHAIDTTLSFQRWALQQPEHLVGDLRRKRRFERRRVRGGP